MLKKNKGKLLELLQVIHLDKKFFLLVLMQWFAVFGVFIYLIVV